MDGSPEIIRDYLKRPYARVLTPDEEYGGYTAEILEFPGCVTEGDTADEALENLEEAAEGWIEAALNIGQQIPEPSDSQGYGGRVALRLPRSLHRRAIQMAEREGTSLNQFIVAAVAERVGASTLYAEMVRKLEEQATQVVATYLQAAAKSAANYALKALPDVGWYGPGLGTPMRIVGQARDVHLGEFVPHDDVIHLGKDDPSVIIHGVREQD